VVQAERGEDIGLLKHHIEQEPDFEDRERPKSILRRASQEDMIELDQKRQREKQYRTEVIEMIALHGLKMKVVDVDYQFDGNKMTVYFTADRRVDFRALVKDLAARYRTRIELRQIGVRDEARRLDGYGICGLRQCCNTFITEFEPVSTQQARLQDLPLNPAKISGNCGRLLCCLRYEVEAYEESKKRFPKVGSRIETEVGNGTIERIDIFKSEAVIRTDEGGWIRYSLKDIEEEETEQKQAEAAEPADTGEEADSSEEPHIEDETAPEIDDEEPDSEGQGADEAEASASSEQVDNKQQSRSRRRGRSRRRRNRSDQRSDSN
jgi:cell fate regulator YaaT (PSP1 superfamily)